MGKKHKNRNFQNNGNPNENPNTENIELSEIDTDNEDIEDEEDIEEVVENEVEVSEPTTLMDIVQSNPIVEPVLPVEEVPVQTIVQDEPEVTPVAGELCLEFMEKPEPEKPIVFYKVGTAMIGNKCMDQVEYTPDLENAKAKCDHARDMSKKTYYVFDNHGNTVYTSNYSTPKDNFYRIGTEWKDGKCINQKSSTVNRDEAERIANEQTKLTGVIHHVFDPSGKVIFSAKKKLTLFKLRGDKNVDWYS